MAGRAFGILLVAMAFSATYGFLVVCRRLSRWLKPCGLTVDGFGKRAFRIAAMHTRIPAAAKERLAPIILLRKCRHIASTPGPP